jgi:uncharacterized membrane protein
MSDEDSRGRRRSRWLLALVFMGAGAAHFRATGAYLAIVPSALPWPRAMVLISGVAEIAGGAGLLVPRWRRAAGLGLILLLAAVWPANWKMALDAAGDAGWRPLLLWARLPLQIPLAVWVWWAARVPPTPMRGATPGRPARPRRSSGS